LDAWPAETYYPNSLLADGAQVQLDEMSFTVHETGPAESHADSYLIMAANGSGTVAFTGDLAFHGMHPYTADGHSGAWLAALDVLGGELAGAGTLYPGHGDQPVVLPSSSVGADPRRVAAGSWLGGAGRVRRDRRETAIDRHQARSAILDVDQQIHPLG